MTCDSILTIDVVSGNSRAEYETNSRVLNCYLGAW